jgi:hypothetical protein
VGVKQCSERKRGIPRGVADGNFVAPDFGWRSVSPLREMFGKHLKKLLPVLKVEAYCNIRLPWITAMIST